MKAPHATTIATLLAVCITKVYGKRTIRRGLDEGSMSMFMPEFAKGKSGSSSKSGKACPDEADNSCLSDTRKASLLAKFGIQITNDNAAGYDKLSDVFIQGAGLARLAAPVDGLTIDALEEFKVDALGVIYVVGISDFSCVEEIYAQQLHVTRRKIAPTSRRISSMTKLATLPLSVFLVKNLSRHKSIPLNSKKRLQ